MYAYLWLGCVGLAILALLVGVLATGLRPRKLSDGIMLCGVSFMVLSIFAFVGLLFYEPDYYEPNYYEAYE